MNVDADTVHLVHLIDLSTFEAIFWQSVANTGVIGDTPTPLPLPGSHFNLLLLLFLSWDAEERREGNQKFRDLYLSDLKEESYPTYTKPQDKQFSQVRLEVSIGSFKHSQQVLS